MIDLNELALFAKVVERKGFAAAGRAVGLPRSTVSRKIIALEERLGVRLLQRSTRNLFVTEMGQAYFRHCNAMLAEAEAAQELIDGAGAEPRGKLRVTCPVSLMQSYMAAMISRFLSSQPKIQIALEATNRRVDVIEEGVDIAFRVRFPPLEDSSLVMRRLAPSRQILVAAPALLAGDALPQEPEALASLPSLALTQPSQQHAWELHRGGEKRIIPFEPRYVTDDMTALRLAAEAGVGIVQLPEYMVRSQLHAGSLMALLPEWAPLSAIIHCVFPSRRGQSPALRSFIDFVAMEFGSLDDSTDTLTS
jgi:DNA-binding transcriptional LysR family regulator